MVDKYSKLLNNDVSHWYDIVSMSYQLYLKNNWGDYGSCKNYVTQELSKYGVTYSKFMYRVKLGKVIADYNIKKEDVLSLGWSKFSAIANIIRHNPALDIKVLLAEAAQLSLKDLKRKYDASKRTALTLNIPTEYVEFVNQALEAACDLAGTTSLGQGLVYLCADFLLNCSMDNRVVNAIRTQLFNRPLYKRIK